MKKFFSNPFFHFGLLVAVILVISLLIKSALSDLAVTITRPIIQESFQPEPTPAQIAGISSDSAQLVTVQRVIDGDTIELSTGEVVRYIGINTPETKHPTKPVECYGLQASQRNQELVEGKLVQLETDISETDRYGRLLRYVWLDDTMINQQLAVEGYAFASTHPPDVKYQSLLQDAQDQAQENNRGLWAECQNKL